MQIKTVFTEEMLMAVVDVDKKNRPDGFQTLAQLKRKVGSLKQKVHRERGQ